MNPRIGNCGSQSQPPVLQPGRRAQDKKHGFCHPSGGPCCHQRWVLMLKHCSYEAFLAVGMHIIDPYVSADTRQMLMSCIRVGGCLRAWQTQQGRCPSRSPCDPHSHSDVLHPCPCFRGFTTSVCVHKAALGSCVLNLHAWSQAGPLYWRLVLPHLVLCL